MKKCQQLKCEDDQTVGIAVELLAGYRLTRTNSYVPHGVSLKEVTPEQFKNQVSLVFQYSPIILISEIMYSCGSDHFCILDLHV